jgi:pimeloyl-ACP methyl ester carboxylesterase
LVMLAPVTHPWTGGIAWYNNLAATPVIGFIFSHLFALPAGLAWMTPGARSAFKPEIMPERYVRDAALPLLMRPSEFTANAYDMVTLKPSVAAQARRYNEITAPVIVIAGDADDTVSIDIHSRAFVAAVRHAKIIVLPGVGHITQSAAPDVVSDAIDLMLYEMPFSPPGTRHPKLSLEDI